MVKSVLSAAKIVLRVGSLGTVSPLADLLVGIVSRRMVVLHREVGIVVLKRLVLSSRRVWLPAAWLWKSSVR